MGWDERSAPVGKCALFESQPTPFPSRKREGAYPQAALGRNDLRPYLS
jgi:hypothetical protein